MLLFWSLNWILKKNKKKNKLSSTVDKNKKCLFRMIFEDTEGCWKFHFETQKMYSFVQSLVQMYRAFSKTLKKIPNFWKLVYN